jgi:hypothetical protein
MKKPLRLALIYLIVALLFYWSMGRQIRAIVEEDDAAARVEAAE